jgi:hypothetical protein
MVTSLCLNVRNALAGAVFVLALLGCERSSGAREIVLSSNPRVACSVVETETASTDAAAAIKRARGVLASAYERKQLGDVYDPSNIAKFEPYHAALKDGVWHVQGTIPSGYHGYAPVVSVCRNDEGAAIDWIVVQ